MPNTRRAVRALLLAWAFATGAVGTACAGTVRRPRKFTLINPLLEMEPTLEFTELRPFKHKLEKLIEVHRSSGDISAASVYFRDLMNGPLFGIEAEAPFVPASLLKVPVMMAVLKRGEEDPAFLRQEVRYEKEQGSIPGISTVTLTPGEFYSVQALLRAMIVDSDNEAVFLLRSITGPGALEEVYTDLGISIPAVRTSDEPINVQEYSRFFRMLYNASYLSHAHSQKALELLSQSRFNGGLVAGVPQSVRVAHKFGERSNLADDARQLHDCGIVYYPPRPYLLCVMTRGHDFTRMAAAIADLSRAVYGEVSAADAK